MSTQTPNAEEPDEPTTAELLQRATDRRLLGVDSKRQSHYHDAHASLVWVIAADEETIVHRQDVRDLARWVGHVEETLGWLRCNFRDSIHPF
jgi:hypothetical protein